MIFYDLQYNLYWFYVGYKYALMLPSILSQIFDFTLTENEIELMQKLDQGEEGRSFREFPTYANARRNCNLIFF